jgi:hypothetical protein
VLLPLEPGTRHQRLLASVRPVDKTEVVTLCGSVRFAAEHLAAHRRLSLEGCVVLLPALPVADQHEPLLPAELLGSLHRRKIDMSDRIHVVNPDGYVGPSTASEIAYAETNGKRVTFEHSST